MVKPTGETSPRLFGSGAGSAGFFWEAASLPVVVAINILALVGAQAAPLASSATPTCWPAQRVPYGSLILSLSVVILGQPDFTANGYRRRRADSDARYALFDHYDLFTGGLVGFSLYCWAGAIRLPSIDIRD